MIRADRRSLVEQAKARNPQWSLEMCERWAVAKIESERQEPRYAKLLPMTVDHLVRIEREGSMLPRTMREAGFQS